jgi:hypothetical protein
MAKAKAKERWEFLVWDARDGIGFSYLICKDDTIQHRKWVSDSDMLIMEMSRFRKEHKAGRILYSGRCGRVYEI